MGGGSTSLRWPTMNRINEPRSRTGDQAIHAGRNDLLLTYGSDSLAEPKANGD